MLIPPQPSPLRSSLDKSSPGGAGRDLGTRAGVVTALPPLLGRLQGRGCARSGTPGGESCVLWDIWDGWARCQGWHRCQRGQMEPTKGRAVLAAARLGAGRQRQIVSPGCSWLPAGDRQRVLVPRGGATLPGKGWIPRAGIGTGSVPPCARRSRCPAQTAARMFWRRSRGAWGSSAVGCGAVVRGGAVIYGLGDKLVQSSQNNK